MLTHPWLPAVLPFVVGLVYFALRAVIGSALASEIVEGSVFWGSLLVSWVWLGVASPRPARSTAWIVLAAVPLLTVALLLFWFVVGYSLILDRNAFAPRW